VGQFAGKSRGWAAWAEQTGAYSGERADRRSSPAGQRGEARDRYGDRSDFTGPEGGGRVDRGGHGLPGDFHATGSRPARRTARLDPLKALRCESGGRERHRSLLREPVEFRDRGLELIERPGTAVARLQ
jgi:hypothetical protein